MIVVAYGANLDSKFGDPIQTFNIVKDKMADHDISIRSTSSLYDTSPVGTGDDQPSYTNAVLIVETEKAPKDLLEILLTIEADLGRVRTVQNAPRPVDLDIIDYNGIVQNDDLSLILPHPRMHTRKFVLVPLMEVSPNWFHPITKTKIFDLVSEAPADQSIEKIA